MREDQIGGIEGRLQELEKELKKLNSECSILKNVLKTACVEIWEWDIVTNKVHISEELKEIFSIVSFNEFLFDDFVDLIHSDDQDKFIDTINIWLKNNRKNNPFEFRITLKDNNKKYFLIDLVEITLNNSKPTKMIALLKDITEAKTNYLALKKSETKYKYILRKSPDPAILVKLAEISTCVDVNDEFTAITGYTRDDLVGKPIKDSNLWYNPEDSYKLRKTLEQKGGFSNLEMKFRNKDDSVRPALLSAKIILIENEPHALIISKDINDIKQVELDLIKAKERAEESDRLKTAFLANISHEIRTPMNIILGFCELLRGKDDFKIETKTGKRYTELIYSNGLQLLDVVNNVIEISKIESGMIELNEMPCPLNILLLELYCVFTNSLEKNNVEIKLNNTLKDSESIILTDQIKLSKILTCLVSNSIKFTNEGYIEIGCTLKDGDTLVFYVEDTGIGMSPEFRNVVFERFRQVDDSCTREYGGVGIGLSIAKCLVELFGGKIWVKSKLDEGSTFYFSIPYKKASK